MSDKFSQLLSVYIFTLPSFWKTIFFDYAFFLVLEYFKDVIQLSSSLHSVWEQVAFLLLPHKNSVCFFLCLLLNFSVYLWGSAIWLWYAYMWFPWLGDRQAFGFLARFFFNWIWKDACLYLIKNFFSCSILSFPLQIPIRHVFDVRLLYVFPVDI